MIWYNTNDSKPIIAKKKQLIATFFNHLLCDALPLEESVAGESVLEDVDLPGPAEGVWEGVLKAVEIVEDATGGLQVGERHGQRQMDHAQHGRVTLDNIQ